MQADYFLIYYILPIKSCVPYPCMIFKEAYRTKEIMRLIYTYGEQHFEEDGPAQCYMIQYIKITQNLYKHEIFYDGGK